MLYMGSSQINPRMKLEVGDRFRVALFSHTPNTNIYMHELQGRWLEVASISEHPMNVRGTSVLTSKPVSALSGMLT